MSIRRRLAALAALALLLLAAAPAGVAAETEQTTVLGLYAQWQSEEMPQGVESVFYDSAQERLVVVIAADHAELQQALLNRVSDPQNIEIRIAQPAQDAAQETGRWKGVLVLAAAYGGGLLVLAAFLFLRAKSKKALPADKPFADTAAPGAGWTNFFGGK